MHAHTRTRTHHLSLSFLLFPSLSFSFLLFPWHTRPNMQLCCRYKSEGENGFELETLHIGDGDMSYALGKGGSTKRLMVAASGCTIEYVKDTAIIAGVPMQRERARTFLGWLLLQRVPTPIDVTGRADVSVVEVPALRRPPSLRGIQRTTNTFCFSDKTAVRKGYTRVLACSVDPEMRLAAVQQIRELYREPGSSSHPALPLPHAHMPGSSPPPPPPAASSSSMRRGRGSSHAGPPPPPHQHTAHSSHHYPHHHHHPGGSPYDSGRHYRGGRSPPPPPLPHMAAPSASASASSSSHRYSHRDRSPGDRRSSSSSSSLRHGSHYSAGPPPMPSSSHHHHHHHHQQQQHHGPEYGDAWSGGYEGSSGSHRYDRRDDTRRGGRPSSRRSGSGSGSRR